jgi:type II secretory pathway predicted ATPase ExeA
VDAFVQEYGRGRRTLLIVDEAQNLPVNVLEELRLLSNINSEKDLVLQILLVGQPELRATLSQPGMRQLAQRISVDFHLRPLQRLETHAYIRHRLQAAGGDPDTFDAEAIEFVHARAAGVPRLINQLCDVALVYGYADGQRRIGVELCQQVMADREVAQALPVFAAAEERVNGAAASGDRWQK